MSKIVASKISAADIRNYHPKVIGHCSTDIDYAIVANSLFSILKEKRNMLPDGVDIRDLAIRLALYLEDVISEGPTWRVFTHLCGKLYGRRLPFYPENEAPEEFQEYYDGEVNFDDVRFLLWIVIQQIKANNTLINPHTPGLALIAMDLYLCLSDNFEKLPINPILNAMFDDYSDNPYGQFNHLRALMEWIFTRNYLLTNIGVNTVLKENKELIKAYWAGKADASVIDYSALMESIFTEVCGPLSLHPKQWLAAMMTIEGCKPECVREVATIDYRTIDLYRITGIDKDNIFLQDCHDEIYKVSKISFASTRGLSETGAVITSLVKFGSDDWYINGSAQILSECPPMGNWREMREKQLYGTSLGDGATELVSKEKYIKCFGGKRHKFFASQREIIKALTPKDQLNNQNEQYLKLLNNADDKTPVFVYVCDDGHLYISEYLADIIPARDNPFRVKTQDARDELFCAVLGNDVDPEVIQYIIDKGWAKTLEMNSIKGKAHGKKLLQENICFLNRFLHPSDYFARHTEL